MDIFHFRALPDATKGVFRDIEINADATFLEFHLALLKSFEFSGNEMASFYLSDDDWEKGEEITMLDMSEGDAVRTMDETRLDDLLGERGDRLFYLYDFMRMWIFYVELVDITHPEKGVEYPRVKLAVGNAPDEDSKDMETSFPVENTGETFGSWPEDMEDPDDSMDSLDDYDDQI